MKDDGSDQGRWGVLGHGWVFPESGAKCWKVLTEHGTQIFDLSVWWIGETGRMYAEMFGGRGSQN